MPGGAPLPDLPAGVWRHYKGGLYLVLGYATESTNALERTTKAVYVGLTPGGTGGSRMRVRDAEEFHQRVHPDGSTCEHQRLQGQWQVVDLSCTSSQPRFYYIGPLGPLEAR